MLVTTYMLLQLAYTHAGCWHEVVRHTAAACCLGYLLPAAAGSAVLLVMVVMVQLLALEVVISQQQQLLQLLALQLSVHVVGYSKGFLRVVVCLVELVPGDSAPR
jgi:hypothetical protein